MNYQINFSNYKHNFSLPSLVVEEDFKDINSDYLKIILMIFKNPDKDYSVNLLSNLLNLSESTVNSAIRYWIQKGVLLDGEEKTIPVQVISKPKAPAVPAKPVNDSELKFLLSNMEHFLARPVTSMDVKTITYIYEYYRLPADVILMAIQYCAGKGKNSIKYIESVCIGWYDQGIVNHTLAEEYLKLSNEQKSNENKIKKMFGITGRTLIASEEKFIRTWFLEYRFDLDVIQLAYEKTVQNTGKVAFAYTNKILTNWHEKGFKTLKDILQNESPRSRKKKTSGGGNNSYDLDEYEKQLNKIPTLD